jgi:hypothetical protein
MPTGIPAKICATARPARQTMMVLAWPADSDQLLTKPFSNVSATVTQVFMIHGEITALLAASILITISLLMNAPALIQIVIMMDC